MEDAVYQYKTDRDPRELLFNFGRCMVHFAVDDNEIRMCTKLDGKKSWFLPFNKGYKDGAGNPPNPDGIKTDYLWQEILKKNELSNIIENYAQIIEEKDEETKKIKRTQIFPRYHQLVSLTKNGKLLFDSVIVVTDRINLDKQIKNTIKNFMQVTNTVGHAESSGDLKTLLQEGKKIIITIVHKFPYILDDIGNEHRKNSFAIIIDEPVPVRLNSMSA